MAPLPLPASPSLYPNLQLCSAVLITNPCSHLLSSHNLALLRRKLASGGSLPVCYAIRVHGAAYVFIALRTDTSLSHSILSFCDNQTQATNTILHYVISRQGSFYEVPHDRPPECTSHMTMTYIYWYSERVLQTPARQPIACRLFRMWARVRRRQSWLDRLNSTGMPLDRRSKRAYSILVDDQPSLYDYGLSLVCGHLSCSSRRRSRMTRRRLNRVAIARHHVAPSAASVATATPDLDTGTQSGCVEIVNSDSVALMRKITKLPLDCYLV